MSLSLPVPREPCKDKVSYLPRLPDCSALPEISMSCILQAGFTLHHYSHANCLDVSPPPGHTTFMESSSGKWFVIRLGTLAQPYCYAEIFC